MNVVFFGMGFSSRASAKALEDIASEPVQITGTTRSAEKAHALETDGIQMRVFDGLHPNPMLDADVRAASHVVVSIAPDAGGDPVLNAYRSTLDAAAGLQWLCYYSTVGVYGDFGGRWIDESAPCHPENARSRQRVAAEQAWRDYAQQRELPLVILRLAGIYGPGRSSFDKLRDGTARRIIKPGQVFNRIHVEDIGRVTAHAAIGKLSGTFNLADNEPAPPQDLIAYAADLAGLAPPPAVPFEDAEMTPMARSFYADNKRVSNRAIKAALGIELVYPTYREGLRAIFDAQAEGEPK